MKHSVTEIWKINGDNYHNYSAQAVEHLEQFTRQEKRGCLRNRPKGKKYPVIYRVASNKPLRVYDNIQRTSYHLAWFYGEKIWFDSESELQEYRQSLTK